MLPVYDCPQYMLMDTGGRRSMQPARTDGSGICECISSFWQRQAAPEAENASQDVIYVKYNRTREDRFQIRTEIREKNGTREVGRRRLSGGKGAHPVLRRKNIRCLTVRTVPETGKTELQDEGMTAVFPYLEGKTRAELWEKF